MNEHKNTILAIVLSLIVVVGWEYFFARPEIQSQAPQPHAQTVEPQPAPPTPPGGQSAGKPIMPKVPAEGPKQLTRQAAIAASPRVAIDTPRLSGSINLHGALIDDLSLKDYHVTTNPAS